MPVTNRGGVKPTSPWATSPKYPAQMPRLGAYALRRLYMRTIQQSHLHTIPLPEPGRRTPRQTILDALGSWHDREHRGWFACAVPARRTTRSQPPRGPPAHHPKNTPFYPPFPCTRKTHQNAPESILKHARQDSREASRTPQTLNLALTEALKPARCSHDVKSTIFGVVLCQISWQIWGRIRDGRSRGKLVEVDVRFGNNWNLGKIF